MKKILCTAIMACILVFSCMGMAFAENTASVTANFRSDDGVLSLSGTIGDTYGTLIFAVVTQSEKELIDVSGANVVTDTLYTAEGGKFETEIILPNTLKNGKYYAYLFTKDGEVFDSFMYTNESNLESLIPTVNNIKSKEDMYALVSSADNPFAIDTDKLGNYLAGISDAFYEIRKNKTYAENDAKEMIKDIKIAEAVGQMRSDVTCEDVLKIYANYFGADYAEYQNFSDEIRSEINRQLVNADYSRGATATMSVAEVIYKNAKIYAEIRYAADWYALKAAVLRYDNAGDLNLVKNDFNKLTNKDNVYRNMYEDRKELTDISKIEEKFEEEAKIVYKSENSNYKPSSGGGGGGGGVSVGTTNAANTVMEEIKNDKNDENYTVEEKYFSDMDTHWSKEYIETLSANGIIDGFDDGTFRPDNSVTRAELVKMIVEAFQLSGKTENSFSDVADKSWYADYVAVAHKNSVVYGDENGNFRPEEFVTRQDAAVMIYRMVNQSSQYDDVNTAVFTDFNEISDYAKTAVATLSENDFVSGNPDGSFTPLKNITRAEVSAILCRVLYR